jgi:dTDP-4-amino-4,6-dideoxygalactose transaminase
MTQAALKLVPEDKIEFIDLVAQQKRVLPGVQAALQKVLDHGTYIMGPEVAELEKQLAEFCGAKYALSCSSGTDALLLVLMAQGIGPGDAVFLPSFTFPATPESVSLLGASPVFVDVLEDTYNMDPASLETSIAQAKAAGLSPKAIIPVDLYGQAVDYDAIEAIAAAHGLWILCDSAQSFGATYGDRSVGNIGLATATSFFPAKPLGCYGDGGAVFTNDKDLLDRLKSIRVHGQGTDKYDNIRVGLNARMDTMQAAILLEKLKIFPDEIEGRQRVADYYSAGLRDVVRVPVVMDKAKSVWAQYTIVLEDQKARDGLQAHLKTQNIPAVVYYPKPLQEQVAYKGYYLAGQNLDVSKYLSDRVLSLPMHPYLTTAQQDRIIAAIRSFFG